MQVSKVTSSIRRLFASLNIHCDNSLNKNGALQGYFQKQNET